MSRLLRRLYSTSSATTHLPSAQETATQFLHTSQSQTPLTRTQYLDSNQLQRFSATLSRPHLTKSASEFETEVPAGYHLAYFTPAQPESELGADGTDTTFNPPTPFTRRMWAGGEVEWMHGPGGRGAELRVGQTVRETTRLVSSEGKRTRAGEEMVVVGVEKEYEILDGKGKEKTALVDRRNWIFRSALDPLNPPTPIPPPPGVPFPTAAHNLDLVQTPVTLFRFSALTFNAHKIHYSKAWCRQVEGHRDLVVHGPLNLVKTLDFWRDVYGKSPRKIAYRATRPIYVGEKYRILMDEEVDGRTEVRIVDAGGKVGMKGVIEAF